MVSLEEDSLVIQYVFYYIGASDIGSGDIDGGLLYFYYNFKTKRIMTRTVLSHSRDRMVVGFKTACAISV